MDWKKYPKKLSVMGVEYKVSYPEKLDCGSAGETCVNSRTMRISKAENETPEKVMRTLCHEYLHALLHVTGQTEFLDEKREESLVVALEHGIEGLFKQLWKVQGDE